MNLLKYFEVKKGKVPVILSCPHGGFLKPKNIPDKSKGVMIADKNKFNISKRIIQVLYEKFEIQIYYILSKIHRSKVDFNRLPRDFSAFNHSSNKAMEIHKIYHEKIKTFYQECVDKFGRCLFFDLHGFTKPHKNYPDIIFGNFFGNTLKIDHDSNIWGFTEIINELTKEFTLDYGLGRSNFNFAYSGGYITHTFYTRAHCNAFQIEVAKYIREDVAKTRIFVESITRALKVCLDNL